MFSGNLKVWPYGFLSLFLLWGCGETNTLTKIDKDFSCIQPGEIGETFKYQFSNLARRELSSGSNLQYQFGPQVWSSNCSGELTMAWKGFMKENDLAEFSYELSKFSFEESDDWPKMGRRWSEQYNSDGWVQMKEQGLSRVKPMGEMRGNPLEHFLGKKCRALFLADGRAYRSKGQLMPADYELESADIGQYFLGGLKVEEWPHRLICPLPKKMIEGAWESPGQRWVDAPPPAKPLVERWTCQKNSEGWLLTMKISDDLEQTSVSGLDHPVSQWTWTRELKALIDPVDLMPREVEWKDEGSWIDKASLQRRVNNESSLTVLHRWKNGFKARRT